MTWRKCRRSSATPAAALRYKRRKNMRNSLLILATATVLSCGTCFGVDAEGSFDRTLNVNGPVDLDLQTASGRLAVRAGGSSVVVIHAKIRVSQGLLNFRGAEQRVRAIESNPPIHQNGNVIRIGHM